MLYLFRKPKSDFFPFNNLPIELKVYVLKFLEPSFALPARMVCKEWDQIISFNTATYPTFLKKAKVEYAKFNQNLAAQLEKAERRAKLIYWLLFLFMLLSEIYDLRQPKQYNETAIIRSFFTLVSVKVYFCPWAKNLCHSDQKKIFFKQLQSFERKISAIETKQEQINLSLKSKLG